MNKQEKRNNYINVKPLFSMQSYKNANGYVVYVNGGGKSIIKPWNRYQSYR